MNLLEKLSSLVHIDISKLKKLQIHIAPINSNNKTVNVEYHDNRTFLVINPEALQQAERINIQNILKAAVNDGNLILEDNTKNLLDDFSIIDKEKGNQKLVEYFKGKLPATDLEILRASL